MRRRPAAHNAGFTLVEVLAAVAILGGALFILLSTHHSALRLHEEMGRAVERAQLMEQVTGEAEFLVLSGTLSHADEFEGRYAGYSWGFEATAIGGTEEIPVPFYQVNAVLMTPDGASKSVTFYVFHVSSTEVLKGGA